MLLSVIAILFLTILTACKEKCPKPIYPKLEAIDRIPKIQVKVKNGILDHNSTLKAFKMIKALRVSEHYYLTLIKDYREEFVK